MAPNHDAESVENVADSPERDKFRSASDVNLANEVIAVCMMCLLPDIP